MAWALVTPSSRGIGFALTRQLLLTTPSSLPVVATCRAKPSVTENSILDSLPDSLQKSARPRLDVQTVDFTSEQSVADFARYCAERYSNTDADESAHLRLAFCIPGRLTPERSPSQIEFNDALETLKLNLLAPMMLAKYFTSFLPQKRPTVLPAIEGLNSYHAVLAFMSARVGSITDNGLGGWYSYRASKAGVNQLVKTLDIYLKGRTGGKAMCVGLHPGTVKTGLSKEFWGSTPEEKLFSPEFAAEKLCGVVEGLGKDDGGRCWDWKGEAVPP